MMHLLIPYGRLLDPLMCEFGYLYHDQYDYWFHKKSICIDFNDNQLYYYNFGKHDINITNLKELKLIYDALKHLYHTR